MHRMTWDERGRRIVSALAAATLLAVASCSGGSGTTVNPDAGNGDDGSGGSKPDGAKGGEGGTKADAGCGGKGDPCGTPGTTCESSTECAGKYCKDHVCAAASPTDGVKDDSETDVDCGGALLANGQANPASDGAKACANGKGCTLDGDCTSTSCQGGKCVPPTCKDKLEDGAETDVDCGGKNCAPCGTNKKCDVASDCVSLDCKNHVCQAATDHDGIVNGGETDTDCGGKLQKSGKANPASDGAPACATGKKCDLGSDCVEGVCAKSHGSDQLTCQAATDTDGVQNDSETGVDCGGATLPDGSPNPKTDGAPACGAGQPCLSVHDCVSLVCNGGFCDGASPTDHVKNDSETDTDCGGALLANGKKNPASDGAPACSDGSSCLLGTDCQSLVCATGPLTAASTTGDPVNCPAGATCTCQPATSDDGITNDSETDTDCGGEYLAGGVPNANSDGAPVCALGKSCLLGTDCVDSVCNSTAGAGDGPADCPAGDNCSCQAATDTDGVRNATETGIDCGGADVAGGQPNPGWDGSMPCATGITCIYGTDCASGVCNNDPLAGPFVTPIAVDCAPGVLGCICQTPSPTDGVKNDSETDVDCGGALLAGGGANPNSDGAPACADEKLCTVDQDCRSTMCSALTGRCVAALSCKGTAPSAAAHIMQLVPCGASCTAAGGICNEDTQLCVQASTPLNPDPGYDYHEALGVPSANGGSQYAGIDTCGTGESTDDPSLQKHESCCKSLLLPPSNGVASTVRLDKYEVTAGRMRQFVESVAAQMLNDKVHNPNGYAYDIQDWAVLQISSNTLAGQNLAAELPLDAIALLPQTYYSALNIEEATGATTMDSSYPSGLQGCYTEYGAAGASTYWWPYIDANGNGIGLDQVGSPARPYTQDYYDTKSMNCAPTYMYAAFCAWDGGRLPTQAEMQAAYGPGQYPWNSATDPTGAAAPFWPSPYPVTANLNPNIPNFLTTVNWGNDSFGGKPGNFYFFPNGGTMNTPPNEVTASGAADDSGLDYSPFIASPGRFPLDVTLLKSTDFDGTEGWQDLAANMMEALAPPSTSTSGGAQFCDCAAFNPGDTSDCTCASTSGNGTKPGVYRPNSSSTFNANTWNGGSWEGHPYGSPQGTDNGGYLDANNPFVYSAFYNFPVFTQYGKYGVRCARNVE